MCCCKDGFCCSIVQQSPPILNPSRRSKQRYPLTRKLTPREGLFTCVHRDRWKAERGCLIDYCSTDVRSTPFEFPNEADQKAGSVSPQDSLSCSAWGFCPTASHPNLLDDSTAQRSCDSTQLQRCKSATGAGTTAKQVRVIDVSRN